MSVLDPDVILIVGRAGSGKKQQSNLFAKYYNCDHLDMGAVLRRHLAEKSEYAPTIKLFTEAGSLIPNDIAIKIVSEEFDRMEVGQTQRRLVLDGFPRNIWQGDQCLKLLQKRFGFTDQEMKAGKITLVVLGATETICRKRLQDALDRSHRSDDKNPIALETRLREYTQATIPMIKKIFTQVRWTKVSIVSEAEPMDTFVRIDQQLKLGIFLNQQVGDLEQAIA